MLRIAGLVAGGVLLLTAGGGAAVADPITDLLDEYCDEVQHDCCPIPDMPTIEFDVDDWPDCAHAASEAR